MPKSKSGWIYCRFCSWMRPVSRGICKVLRMASRNPLKLVGFSDDINMVSLDRNSLNFHDYFNGRRAV